MDRSTSARKRFTAQVLSVLLLIFGLAAGTSCGGGEGKSKKSGSSTAPVEDPAPAVTRPSILNPASAVSVSNSTSLTISGTCTTGNTITLSGASDQSSTCSSGGFSFTVTPAEDGTYLYDLRASQNGLTSAEANLEWTRDRVAPGKIAISGPGASPYLTGSDSLSITGVCESGAVLTVEDETTNTTITLTCTDSAFAYPTGTKVSDGNYSFTFSQEDAAGNVSVTTTFLWQLDTSMPETPVISAPMAEPHYTSSSALTISGTCTPDYTVVLSGSSSQTVGCSNPGATFSFAVDMSIASMGQGIYDFYVHQNNGAGGSNSQTDRTKVVYDATAPVVPGLSSPVAVASGTAGTYVSAGNITLTGSCETGATVNLTGGDTQTTVCAGGEFSFSVTAECAATKSFSFSQTDKALNSSTSTTSLSWTRDCTMLADPVIESPSSKTHVSKTASLTLSGSCDTGMTVELAGDVVASDVTTPAGVLQTECVDNGFEFIIDKSSDTQPAMKYALTLQQMNNPVAPTQVSNLIGLTWIRAGAYHTSALYSLDDVAPGVDRSGYGNGITDGLLATTSVAGIDAQGRHTNNTTALGALHHDAHRSYAHQMTIELWVKLDAFTIASNSFATIAQKAGSWNLKIERQGGSSKYKLAFEAYTDDACGSLKSTSPNSLDFGVPHTGYKKIAVLWNQGQVELYYDNQLIKSDTFGTAGQTALCDISTGQLWLGATGGASGFLSGAIDEFAVSQKLRDPNRTAPLIVD